VPIEERVPGISPELARLVGRMLARERGDRPRDLAEVRQVLARLAPRPSRSFGASRLGAALVAVIAVGILGWSVVHATSRRRSELDAKALLTTDVAATGASEVAEVPPLPGTAAATAPEVAASPATPLPELTSVEERSPVGYRPPPAAPLRPTESAVSRRAPGIADADAGVAAKGPPPAASASAQPAAPARHKGGGLFEGVPF
jgi:hypothetical protein